MEEGKHVEHGLEFFLRAGLEDFLRKLGVCTSDVLTKTIWRLSDDLNGSLKDTKRESIRW
jgi:hypothetical protein